MLRGDIKFGVAARAEELKKFFDVPCLDSKGRNSAVKYVMSI